MSIYWNNWKDQTQQNNASNSSGITNSYYTTRVGSGNVSNGMTSVERPSYTQGTAVKNAGNKVSELESAKPAAYQSSYSNQIQGLIDQIMNRGKFEYDASDDPLYRQYADRYMRQGRIASKDAQGQTAALSGGYGNTYGAAAGAAAYQQYLEGLNDKADELRNTAYSQWQDEGNNQRSNLSMLQGQDDTEYGRYRDSVSDWQNELNYYYQKYNDMSDAEYQRYLNDAAAWEADRDWWANWYGTYGDTGGSYGGGSGRNKETDTGLTDQEVLDIYKATAENAGTSKSGPVVVPEYAKAMINDIYQNGTGTNGKTGRTNSSDLSNVEKAKQKKIKSMILN